MAKRIKEIPDQEDDIQPGGQAELTVEAVLKDFKRAWEAKKDFMEAAREDYEFFLGKQWEDKDVTSLQKVGVRALTINKIAPHIQLLKGIESQNRSDFRAFPEGDEDTVTAEVATRLMKHAIKDSELDFKTSEVFEDGNICGEAILEPWIKYPYRVRKDGTVDMTGKLCWRKDFYDMIFPDPTHREYDMSDAKYICKFTSDLTANQLIELFPDQKDMIEEMRDGGKINLDRIALDRDQTGVSMQRKGYREEDTKTDPWIPKDGFDLLDYYYQKYIERFYVADFKLKQVRLCKNEKEADRYVAAATRRDPPKTTKPSAKKIVRLQPELWVAFVTGGESEDFLAHGPAWSFPRWNDYPLFTYRCFFSSAPLKGGDRKYLIQGVTRRIKDLNRELNKRRTQELRHLNQSANSGWQGEEDAFVDEDKWESFGSTPGVILKHKKGSPTPIKIQPTALSQGHAQLAAEHTQDMRDAIGVNPETLAIEADQSSGRAIALRQKQGMVLVQGQFDNLSRTRKRLGRFVLSVLPELYDVEKAMRTLGQAFLKENFKSPVPGPGGVPLINPQTGEPVTQYDQKLAMQTINQVLSDAELGCYDVAVGESISTETIALANYMQLMDMAKQGLPVPPEMIAEESTLSDSQKKRLAAAFKAQAMAASAQPSPGKKPAKKAA